MGSVSKPADLWSNQQTLGCGASHIGFLSIIEWNWHITSTWYEFVQTSVRESGSGSQLPKLEFLSPRLSSQTFEVDHWIIPLGFLQWWILTILFYWTKDEGLLITDGCFPIVGGPQGIIQAVCHFQCKPMVGNLFSRNPKCAIGRWFILQLWIAELNYYILLPFSGGYILILWVYVLSATLLIFIAWLTIIPTTYLSNCPDAARCCVSWLIKSMNSDTCASGFQNGCMNLMENQ